MKMVDANRIVGSRPRPGPVGDPSPSATRPGGGRPVLLIAGGSRSLQTVYAQFMEQRGFSTCCVNTGQGVLDRLTHPPEPIDLVLIDGDMPGMRDARLLHRLRPLCPTIPLLVIVDGLHAEARAAYRRLGVSELLSKPLTAQSLMEAAVNLLPASHLLPRPPIQP